MELTTISRRNNPIRKFGRKALRSKYLLLMILPAIVFYVVFCYFPMYGIVLAFKNLNPVQGILGSPWVGLDNFKAVFDDEYFWPVFTNTLIIGSVKIVIGFLGAIVTAILLNEIRMRRTKKVVQTIVTFPHFLSWVVVSGFVVALFANQGAINAVIEEAGGKPIDFMGNKPFFFVLIFTTDIWKEAGWGSIIYLATMAGIPQDQYEAADIDGATRLQKIWHITLPGVKPVAILLLIMSVGGVLSAGFDQLLNLTPRSLTGKVDIIDTYIYRNFLQNYDPEMAGVGSAVGLFKSVIGFFLVISVDRIAKACGERGII